MDTGLRRENATKQRDRAAFRFIGTEKALAVFEEAVAQAAALLCGRLGLAPTFRETEITR